MLWTLLQNGLTYLYNLFVRVTAVKFVVFTAFYWLLTKLFEVAHELLDGLDWFTQLPSLVALLPNDIRFYLILFQFHIGVPMIIAAFVVRFTIRRLPVIG